MAWLNTTEKDRSQPRIKLLEGEPSLPDIGPHQYIIDLMQDVGPIDLTWTELKSWITLTGIDLCAWESRIIMRLSHIYQSHMNQYNNTKATSPYVEVIEGEALQSNIKSILKQSVK